MRAQGGFTLLEVLVALTVLSLIITIAFDTLRLGSRSWESGIAQAYESSGLRSIPGFLNRQMSQIVSLEWGGKAAGSVAFEGGQQNVRFIAPAPQREAFSGLFEFSLQIERGDEGVDLLLYYQPYQPGTERFLITSASPKSTLLEGMERASFSYYGSTRRGVSASWQRSWDSRFGAIPALIRLTIEQSPGTRAWPELVIPLHTGMRGI